MSTWNWYFYNMCVTHTHEPEQSESQGLITNYAVANFYLFCVFVSCDWGPRGRGKRGKKNYTKSRFTMWTGSNHHFALKNKGNLSTAGAKEKPMRPLISMVKTVWIGTWIGGPEYSFDNLASLIYRDDDPSGCSFDKPRLVWASSPPRSQVQSLSRADISFSDVGHWEGLEFAPQ